MPRCAHTHTNKHTPPAHTDTDTHSHTYTRTRRWCSTNRDSFVRPTRWRRSHIAPCNFVMGVDRGGVGSVRRIGVCGCWRKARVPPRISNLYLDYSVRSNADLRLKYCVVPIMRNIYYTLDYEIFVGTDRMPKHLYQFWVISKVTAKQIYNGPVSVAKYIEKLTNIHKYVYIITSARVIDKIQRVHTHTPHQTFSVNHFVRQ